MLNVGKQGSAIGKVNLLLLVLLLGSCKQIASQQTEGMVLIPSGTFEMGGDNMQAWADEFPKHLMRLKSYWMDATEVTNAQFRKFVEELLSKENYICKPISGRKRNCKPIAGLIN